MAFRKLTKTVDWLENQLSMPWSISEGTKDLPIPKINTINPKPFEADINGGSDVLWIVTKKEAPAVWTHFHRELGTQKDLDLSSVCTYGRQ